MTVSKKCSENNRNTAMKIIYVNNKKYNNITLYGLKLIVYKMLIFNTWCLVELKWRHRYKLWSRPKKW